MSKKSKFLDRKSIGFEGNPMHKKFCAEFSHSKNGRELPTLKLNDERDFNYSNVFDSQVSYNYNHGKHRDKRNESPHESRRRGVNERSTSTRKFIPSIPAAYKFSWKLFVEPSYLDNITPSCFVSDKLPGDSQSQSRNYIRNSLNDDNSGINEENIKKCVIKFNESLKYDFPPGSYQNHEIQCTVNEMINDKSKLTPHQPVHMYYHELQECLDKAAKEIEKFHNISNSIEAQDKVRQHKLLVLALLGQTVKSTAVYRETGSMASQWMFKKIYLVGDSRVHDLYARQNWVAISSGRPHLICKEDLSLFSLMQFLMEVIPIGSVKGRMLVICSVGIRDAARTIDEQGVLLTLETILAELKRIKKEFKDNYGGDNDILFADILPVDINQMLSLHHESVSVEITKEVEAQSAETTLKFAKFAYLLTKNMMVEDLSRIKHLPTCEIFSNQFEIKTNPIFAIQGLKDGLNPDVALFPMIGKTIHNIFFKYNALKDPPDYDCTQREIFFVLNEKYVNIDKFWPKAAMHEKPTFIFLPSVVSDTIAYQLENFFPLHELSVLVILFDISEVLQTCSLKDCSGHAPLKLDIPLFQSPEQIFDGLVLVRKKLQTNSSVPNVIITTICPIDYNQATEKAVTCHKIFKHDLQILDKGTVSKLNNYLVALIDKVNLYIIQSNRLRGLPSWDICSQLYRRDRDGLLHFQPLISPSDGGPVTPQTVAKLMMYIAQTGKESVKSLNWMAYLDKQRYEKATQSQTKNYPKNRQRKYSRDVSLPCEDRRKSLPNRNARRSVSPPPPPPPFAEDEGHPWDLSYQPDSPRPSMDFCDYAHGQSEKVSDYKEPQFPVLWQDNQRDGRVPPLPEQQESYSEHQPKLRSLQVPPSSQNLSDPPHRLTLSSQYCQESALRASGSSVLPTVSNATENNLSHITTDVLSASRKKISFGIKPKDDENNEPMPLPSRSDFSEPSSGSTVSLSEVPEPAVLGKIVQSLRSAHDAEVEALRKNPESHSKYEQQHSEFVEQAVLSSHENDEMPDMDSIERVWTVFWKKQLEKSFVKTWEKRVEQLTSMVANGKKLPPATQNLLNRLTKSTHVDENESSVEKFSFSETNLLNKFKKKRFSANSLIPNENEKSSGVILGERMLSQVQKGWKSIGCKKSQVMLDKAVEKIKDFMEKPNVSVVERVQYINLGIKLNAFKDFLISKEANPYDLDYKSISQITVSFNATEMAEYVAGVIQNKGIEQPASDDIAVICKAITDSHKKKELSGTFVKGGVINV